MSIQASIQSNRKTKNIKCKRKAAKEEVDKLLISGFIREVNYQDLLTDVVLVKKCSSKCRMCVDYTNLNKANTKDCFPLSCIDQLVDLTSGHQLLSSMDTFSGYNHIMMTKAEEMKRHSSLTRRRTTTKSSLMALRM